MSEPLGVVEREALERARLGEIARRREAFARLEQVAELEALGVAEKSGDRSTSRLLQETWRVGVAEAKRLVGEAADLCVRTSIPGEQLPARLPATAAAAAAGTIGEAHIAIIRKTMARLDRVEGLPVATWEQAESTLAHDATLLGPRGLQAAADRLLAHLDPDGEEPPEDDAARDDELLIVRRKDGSVLYRGRIGDPVDGEAFLETIDAVSGPAGPSDARALKRRRADGLKDVIEDARSPHGIATDARPGRTDNARDEEPDAATDNTIDENALIPVPRRPDPSERTAHAARPGRALLTITLDQRWLTEALAGRGRYGLLDSGARVHPGTLRRWACDAEVVPVVLGARSEPLDVGRLQRTVTDALRRALNLRDGGCAFPGCDRKPRRCQAHHIRHWIDHGPTEIDNMVLLCRFHHQLLHHGHWTVAIVDGRPSFRPPDWIDPDRRPRLGGRPRVPT
ncbi:uncharacterized protein DUF222 [Actinomycetospora succinea]|uniref:Uncharacterized protein DUF222 n=1 Tax=Actinomycetospora succinea TaxID=663603 RepID=A0A4R6VLK9_9PSEU|nr:HNH endonuclease signature motif containing protein [Actinomycetospora succinea]TDQ62781.1 uncharacterized protein DUF222 [Actinomycetospora succinea]